MKPRGGAKRTAAGRAHSTQGALARLRPAGGWPSGIIDPNDAGIVRIAYWLEKLHRAAYPGSAYDPLTYRANFVAVPVAVLRGSLHSHERTSTLKEERRRAAAICRHALALHELLSALDGAAPGYLNLQALRAIAPEIEAQDAKDRDSDHWPPGFRLPHDRVGALRTLVIATTWGRPVLPYLAEMAAAYDGYLARGPKQGGSSGRLEQRKRGDPRLVFARECVGRLTDLLGADAVKGTEGGTADAYMRAVWTFATGVPADGANLFHFLTQALRTTKPRCG